MSPFRATGQRDEYKDDDDPEWAALMERSRRLSRKARIWAIAAMTFACISLAANLASCYLRHHP